MKKLFAGLLLLGWGLFSGFILLDLRPTFSFEIFSSPYYRILKKAQPEASAKIGFVPVSLDFHTSQNLTFQDARIPQLLQVMNSFLADSLQLPMVQLPVNSITTTPNNRPDLFLGSELGPQKPMYILSDCPQEKDFPEYCLRIGGQLGSKAWMEELKGAMTSQNLDYVIIYQLGEGYIYPNGKMKQHSALTSGRHAPPSGLDMGTNFWLPMSQKWVALNKPIDVLFVKGILITKEGKALRLGAEGITAASKAHFLEQVVNISHEFSEAELNSIQNNLRREDLPNQPLNWQEACRQLTTTLTNSNLQTQNGYVKR